MNELVDAAGGTTKTPRTGESRLYGVTPAEVINNVDFTGEARVQVSLPSLPDLQPWARVAVPLAGASRGTFLIPQIGDEVLVAFAGGDVRDPYVIGSMWNGRDQPPVTAPLEATTRFLVLTPLGHQVDLDDLTQTVEVTTLVGQKITLSPQAITLATAGDTATVELGTEGTVSIQAAMSLTIEAPSVTIKGATVELNGSTAATIKGGGTCSVEAGLVRIN